MSTSTETAADDEIAVDTPSQLVLLITIPPPIPPLMLPLKTSPMLPLAAVDTRVLVL